MNWPRANEGYREIPGAWQGCSAQMLMLIHRYFIDAHVVASLPTG